MKSFSELLQVASVIVLLLFLLIVSVAYIFSGDIKTAAIIYIPVVSIAITGYVYLRKNQQ